MTDAELDALCNKLRSDVIALMDVRVAADAIAELRQENESLRAQCGLRQIQGYHEGKQRAEADNAALRKLLLRWLQIINRAKKDAATVSEWDKLRQETDALLAGKEKQNEQD